MSIWLNVLLVLLVYVTSVRSHGKLVEPLARNAVLNELRSNSTEQQKCSTENIINYSDKGQFCGGRGAQAALGGKCSACGDLYSAPYPRPHDLGGVYAKTIKATRAYRQGQTITTKVYISAAHKGTFQFRLCNKLEKPGSGDILTECFLDESQRIVLRKPDGSSNVTVTSSGVYETKVQLPADVTCPYGCSLQWWYRAGNNPEPDQEHFVNCADILIMSCGDFLSGQHAEYCGGGPSDDLRKCTVGGSGNGTGGASGSGGIVDTGNEYPGGDDGYDDSTNAGSGAGTGSGAAGTGSGAGTGSTQTGSGSASDASIIEWTGTGTCTGSGTWEGRGVCASLDNGGISCTGAGRWRGTGQCSGVAGPIDTQGSNTAPSTNSVLDSYDSDLSCNDCSALYGEYECSVCCKPQYVWSGIVASWDKRCKKRCPGIRCNYDKCQESRVFERTDVECIFPDFAKFNINSPTTCEQCTNYKWSQCPNDCCELQEVSANNVKVKSWQFSCNNFDCDECTNSGADQCSSSCCVVYEEIPQHLKGSGWCNNNCPRYCPAGFCRKAWFDKRRPECSASLGARGLIGGLSDGDMSSDDPEPYKSTVWASPKVDQTENRAVKKDGMEKMGAEGSEKAVTDAHGEDMERIAGTVHNNLKTLLEELADGMGEKELITDKEEKKTEQRGYNG